MTLIKPKYSMGWVRLLSISMVERWEGTEAKNLTPEVIAGLELGMAKKLQNLSFSITSYLVFCSFITKIFCSIKFRSISFSDKKKRSLLSNWIMLSENILILNYRLFIEKLTILYLMEQIELKKFREIQK